MTVKQLKNIGMIADSWQPFNKIQMCLFSNEGSLFGSSDSEYFLDSSTELLFIRMFRDKSKKILIPGGLFDNSIGKYHYVYGISDISVVQ